MSHYSTTIRNYLKGKLCENYPSKYIDSLSYKNLISSGKQYIFDFDYPLFDTNYKDTLETKILKHYFMREIGQETIGQFKLQLDMKLNEIMPYYNKLYESETYTFNPLYDYTINETTTRDKDITGDGTLTTNAKANETSNRNENSENEANSVFYQYPQTQLSGNNDYATNKTHDTSTEKVNSVNTYKTDNVTTQQNISTTKSDESYERKVDGTRNSPSKLINEYRKSLINIDKMIIDDLDILFMGCW